MNYPRPIPERALVKEALRRWRARMARSRVYRSAKFAGMAKAKQISKP